VMKREVQVVGGGAWSVRVPNLPGTEVSRTRKLLLLVVRDVTALSTSTERLCGLQYADVCTEYVRSTEYCSEDYSLAEPCAGCPPGAMGGYL
jgi:hypothetical protein